MSSILKALKKLEAEKAARLSGQVEISRAILTEKAPRPGHRSRLPVIFCVLVMAVAVLGGSMALWRSRGSTPSGTLQANAPLVPTQPAPVKASPSSQPAAVPSAQVPAAPAAVVNRTPSAAVPVPPPLPKPREQLPRQASPAPVRETVPTPFARPLPAPVATPQPPADTTARPAPVPASPQPHAVPALRVSGIAWQKDSTSRLAIVNGQPVGLGAAVDGATIEEIFPDRVRFAYKGEKIEVGLGRSSKGE